MELSYPARKLKYKKRSLRFQLVFVDILVALVFAVLFSIGLIAILNNWIRFNNRNLAITLLSLISALLTILGVLLAHFIMYRRVNKVYTDFYFKLLEDEAALEGLTFFKNNSEISKEEIALYELHNGIKNIVVEEVLTQSSSSAYFDLLSFHYENNSFGVIIKTKIDTVITDIIQLRNDGRRGVLNYEDKKVKQYGLGTSSNIKEFAVYSSMNTEIYNILKEGIVEDLYQFSNFCRCPIVLTILENNVFIFLDGWHMHMIRTLKEKDDLSIIDVQIEALKMLQNYIEKVTLIAQEKGEDESNG